MVDLFFLGLTFFCFVVRPLFLAFIDVVLAFFYNFALTNLKFGME